MKAERIAHPNPDKSDIEWYINQGQSEEDAQLHVEDDALRADSYPEQAESESPADEDPLKGDVDRWVHPDETREES